MKRLRHKIPKKYIKDKVVLDVGTGTKSIEFLKSCGPKKIIAVSISKNEIQEIKESGLANGSNIKLLIEDITNKNFKLTEKVDVIFAGYFFSALEGTRPFQSLTVMKKLKEFMNKEGIIIIEDFYWEDKLKEPQDTLCKKLWNLKDGLKTILGVSFPKQIPSTYLKQLLNTTGYKIIIDEVGLEDRKRYKAKLEKYREQVMSINKYIDQFKILELKEGLATYTNSLIKKIERIGKSAYFAHDYLIIAKLNTTNNKR